MYIGFLNVKDTHNHGVYKNNYYIQRRNVRTNKFANNINKEIVKIRNTFQIKNWKNNFFVKNVTSRGRSLNFKNCSLDFNMDDHDDGECCLGLDIRNICLDDDFTQEFSNLVVCNNNDFKINDKPMQKKAIPNKEKRNKVMQNKCVNVQNENIMHDFLRIECTYARELNLPQSNAEEDKETSTHNVVENNHKDFRITSFQQCQDVQESDLQNLLIMMAISPPNEDDSASTTAHTSQVTCINDNDINLEEKINRERCLELNTLKSEDITDILNIKSISQIRVEMNNRQKYIIQKYIKKWRDFVDKKNKYLTQQRKLMLDQFFDKFEKKKQNDRNSNKFENKARSLAKDYNRYQHRYKLQKHIIALQKAKLEEQNRLIEELKYNKIVEASKQSVDRMRDEVRRTYFEIDRHLKPKIKCLTNELKIHEIEEPSLILHCLKVPQFLQRMEKRAREREEKHAMIRERRRQMEEERVKLKQQAELAKAEMDKDEKIKRMKELKLKRKREKIEYIRRKEYAEKMRSLIVMADLHYEKSLMSKYGTWPLKRLIEIKHDNMEKAKSHYLFQLKKNIFLHWMWYTEDMWYERNYKAENFNRKKLLKKAFDRLRKNHYEYVLKKQVAEDYYELYVTQIVFRYLQLGVQLVKKEYEIKLNNAAVYYNSNLLFKCFTSWRALPALNALTRELEARKARWREKVLQVVPDYIPPDD